MSKKSARQRRRDRKKKQQHHRDKMLAIARSKQEEGNFQAAANLLRPLCKKHPRDDELKRTLVRALWTLAEYSEAAHTIASIGQKSAEDLRRQGLAHLLAKNWGQAISPLEQSLQIEASSFTCHLLAGAHAAGLDTLELCQEEHTSDLTLVKQYLAQAMELPDCPIEAILRLARLAFLDGFDTAKRIEVLRQGLTLHPHYDKLRHELAEELLAQQEWDQSWEVIALLLATETIPPKSAWLAYRTAVGMGDMELALSYLDVMPYAGWGISASGKIKGDLLLGMGQKEEAIDCYTKDIEKADQTGQLVGYASRALIHFSMGHTQEMVRDALHTVSLWFDLTVKEGGVHHEATILIETDWLTYDGESSIEKLVRTLLHRDTEMEIAGDLRGRLLFMEYLYDGEQDPAHLLQAAELTNHPLLHYPLMWHYAGTGDLVAATRHYLAQALWEYSDGSGIAGDPFYQSFEIDTASLSKKVRLGVHQAAIKSLRGCASMATLHIIFPFYKDFWRGVLTAGRLATELLTACTEFQTQLPQNCKDDQMYVLWDYAWAQQELGNLGEAQQAYESYLAYNPKGAGTLHNLSLILEQGGNFDRALKLQQEAAGIAPDDKSIQDRLQSLSQKEAEHKTRRAEAPAEEKSSPKEPPPGTAATPVAQKQQAKPRKRRSLSKKLRYQVLVQYGFRCIYCGRSPDTDADVVLHVDHVLPVSKGGTNDPDNLVASCRDCNLGKSDSILPTETALDRQQQQIELLEKQREQLQMFLQWQREKAAFDEEAVQSLIQLWDDLVHGYGLNKNGVASLRERAGQFSPAEIAEAMRIAAHQYLLYADDPDKPTKASVEFAWSKVGGICHVRRAGKDQPYLRDLYAIRAGLQRRLHYFDKRQGLSLMKRALAAGISVDTLREFCSTVRNWTSFQKTLEHWIQTGSSQEQVDGRP